MAKGIRPNPGGKVICIRLEGGKPGRNDGIQNSIRGFLSERVREGSGKLAALANLSWGETDKVNRGRRRGNGY